MRQATGQAELRPRLARQGRGSARRPRAAEPHLPSVASWTLQGATLMYPCCFFPRVECAVGLALHGREC